MTGASSHCSAFRPRFRGRLALRLRSPYAGGCDISGDSTEGFDETVELARRSDAAVMVMGKAGLTDDCTSGEGRDRASLDLPGVQEDLVRAVAATGTPGGSGPGGRSSLGQPGRARRRRRGGDGLVAGTARGQRHRRCPGGRCEPGWQAADHLSAFGGPDPVYHSHKVSGNRSHWKVDYADLPAEPLYPFGHGLSYTTFELASALDPVEVTMDGSVTISVDVSNTGERDGDEVVQVYVRDLEASVTRPVSELKGFARVTVPAATTHRVVFQIDVGQLGFSGPDHEYVVEPGKFEVSVDTSAGARRPVGTFTVAAGATARRSPSRAPSRSPTRPRLCVGKAGRFG